MVWYVVNLSCSMGPEPAVIHVRSYVLSTCRSLLLWRMVLTQHSLTQQYYKLTKVCIHLGRIWCYMHSHTCMFCLGKHTHNYVCIMYYAHTHMIA